MEPLEERIKQLEFYQGILLRMINKDDYPFYQLIMEKGLTEEEMVAVFSLCEEVQKRYEEQCEAEFVHYTALLLHFVGMLNSKLEPLRVIQSLKKQNLYKPLMEKLEEIIIEDIGGNL